MRFLLIIIVMAGLLVTGATKAETYQLIGSGNLSCGTWTADRPAYGEGAPITQRSQRAIQEQAWVLGFLSGIGFASKGDDPLAGTDADGVWAWIDNYCLTNPIKKIVDAAKAFYYAHPHP